MQSFGSFLKESTWERSLRWIKEDLQRVYFKEDNLIGRLTRACLVTTDPQHTDFLLPDGTRLQIKPSQSFGWTRETHAEVARQIGSTLGEVLQHGVVRLNRVFGIAVNSNITEIQARILHDDFANEDITIDVMLPDGDTPLLYRVLTAHSADSIRNFIKKALNHTLEESLDQPLQWRWIVEAPRKYKAEFDVGEQTYQVSFMTAYSETTWDCLFTSDSDWSHAQGMSMVGVNGTGHEFAVFATVVDVLKAFIAKVHPDSVAFTADKSERSRVRLYDRFIKLVSTNIPGYKGNIASLGNYNIIKEAHHKTFGQFIKHS